MDMQAVAEAAFAKLNAEDECHAIEAKTASEAGASSLTTICAFANRAGGVLLLGVRRVKDGLFNRYEAVGIDDPDKVQQEVAGACFGAFSRKVVPDIGTARIDGKTVVVVQVPAMPPSPKHLYLTKWEYPSGVFIRVGAVDQHRYSREDLAGLISEQEAEQYDSAPVEGATEADYDERLIRDYVDHRLRRDPHCDDQYVPTQELMRGLRCGVDVKGTLTPTATGILLFGSKFAVRQFFPLAARVDYVRVPGTAAVKDPGQAADHVTDVFSGPLLELIGDVSARMLADTPPITRFSPGGLRREDLRRLQERVVREILVNAVMHRSYREHAPVLVTRYDNRFEVQNPGNSLVPVDRLGNRITRSRNPSLAAVLHDLGLAENRGSGIGFVRRTLEENGFAFPIFNDDPVTRTFTAWLLFRPTDTADTAKWFRSFGPLVLGQDERQILFIAREARAVNSVGCRSVLQVDEEAASSLLRGLAQKGVLTRHRGSSGTYYLPAPALDHPERFRWKPEGVVLADQPAGEAAAAGAAPGLLPIWLHAVVVKLGEAPAESELRRAVLLLCDWRSLTVTEIAHYLGKDRDQLRRTLVGQLQREGLITTIGGALNPIQTFRTTDRGREEANLEVGGE